MSDRGGWGLKGIHSRTREMAREAAREEGLTLAEYLSRLLQDDGTLARPREMNEIRPPSETAPRENAQDVLDRLTKRIEAVEARSTLAITGIDQSVVGLLKRIEQTDQASSELSGHVDVVMEDARSLYDELKQAVARLEADDTPRQNTEGLRALETALSKLADHVYREGAEAQNETDAIKGRVEAGFTEIGERVETLEAGVSTRLNEATDALEKVVQEAELRSEGANRHLAGQFSALSQSVQSAIEASQVTAQASDASQKRMDDLDQRVTGTVTTVENSLKSMQSRLTSAETHTNTALESLEKSLGALDERLKAVPDAAGREDVSALEVRFEQLATELRASVESVRGELAAKIAGLGGAGDGTIAELRSDIASLRDGLSSNAERQAKDVADLSSKFGDVETAFEARIAAVEAREAGEAPGVLEEKLDQFANAVEKRFAYIEAGAGAMGEASVDAIREEVARLSESVNERLEGAQQRVTASLSRIGEELSKLSTSMETRVRESEQRNAAAIEQVGTAVNGMAQRMDARQRDAMQSVEQAISNARADQDAKVSETLATMSTRLQDMQNQTREQMSPVQRAIASLAARMEALESFNAPPFSEQAQEEQDAVVAALHAAVSPAPAAEAEEEPEPQPSPAPMASSLTSGISLNQPSAAQIGDQVRDDPVEAPEEAPVELEDLPVFESQDEQASNDSEDWGDTEPEYAAEPAYDGDGDAASDPFESVFETATEETGFEEPAADPFAPWETSETTGADDADVFEADGVDDDDSISPFEEEHPERDELEALAVPRPALSDLPEPAPDATQDDDTRDYLSRARAAALAASEENGQSVKGKRGELTAKVPLYAAASAVALAAVGTTGYLYLRGTQPPPAGNAMSDATPSSSTQTSDTPSALAMAALLDEPEAPSIAGNAATSMVDEDLFEVSPSKNTLLGERETAEGNVLTVASMQPTDGAIYAPIPDGRSIQAAIQAGDPAAKLTHGQNLVNDGEFAEGVRLITLAAEDGLAAAQYRLAKLHERGLGVPRDIETARVWTERAAAGQNVKAMHDLAVFYAEGEGGEQSYARAAEWFRNAAEFGVVDSQFNLAVLYERGLGVTKNVDEAAFWFATAQAAGDTGAGSRLEGLESRMERDAHRQSILRAARWQAETPDPRANGEFEQPSWGFGAPNQVRAVQRALVALGHTDVVVNGTIDPATKAAIRRFELAEGLPSTGELNVDVITRLNEGATISS